MSDQGKASKPEKVVEDDAKWRAELTSEQYRVAVACWHAVACLELEAAS